MNKKFSTLVAGALLVTSVGTVSAQVASTTALQKYENGKYYVIAGGVDAAGADGVADSTLSVTKGADGFILSMSSSRAKTLAEIDSALWKVTITTTPGASTPTYQFTNKATGLPLSIDLKQVASFDIAPSNDSLKVGGGINMWKNAPSLSVAAGAIQPLAMLSSSLDGDSAAVLAMSTVDNTVKAFKIGNNEVNVAPVTSATDYTTLQVRFYEANSVYLNAADLNTMMWTANTSDPAKGSFKLNYTPGLIGSVNEPNIFSKDLQAVPATGLAADYTKAVNHADSIYLKIKDVKVKSNLDGKTDVQAFAMLDTAYYNLNQVTDTVANKFRQFVYADTVGTAIQTANGSLPQFAFKFKYFPTQDSIAIYTSSAAKRQIYNDGSTYWKDANASISLTDTIVNMVSLVKGKHTEFSVGSESNGTNSASVRFYFNPAVNGKLAIIPSGYYYIQNLNADDPILTDKKNGYYYTIGLDSVLTYLPDGNKDWMTASHWVVKTDGNYSTISNREFMNNGGTLPTGLFYETADYSATNMVVTDLDGCKLKFVPVADLTKTGYFNEPKPAVDGDMKAYGFQYFTGFDAVKAFINTKGDKDSTLNVQEAEKAAKFFELVCMTDATESSKLNVYTYQKDKDNKDVNPLTRAAYQIRVKVPVGANVAETEREYVILDGKNYKISKKSAGTKPATFFLKKTTKEFNYILVDTATVSSNTPKATASKVVVSDATSSVNDLEYVTLNGRTSSFTLTEETQPLYRRLGKTMDENEFTDLTVDTANFYVTSNPSRFLYENTSNTIAGEHKVGGLHYLGDFNIKQYPDKKPAMFIDTAYVRNETKRPQYMLALRPNYTHSKPCPDDPSHPVTGEDALKADYLVNLADSTATVKDAIFETYYTRLAFVPAKHKEDKLIITNSKFTGTKDAKNDTIDLSKNAFNKVSFQFRLVKEGSNDFYIESSKKGEFIQILNGVPVLTSKIEDAEKFNLTKVTDNPLSNDGIETETVQVVAGEGFVTVYGAQGKKIVVSDVLGKTTTVIATSDSETISAVQGLAIIAVEGEAAIKAIVK